MQDPHEFLKCTTSGLHERAERAFSRFNLHEPAGYGAFLLAQAEALLPLERAADALGLERLLPDWPQRRRGGLIASDLQALRLPLPAAGDLVAGRHDPLGIAYVLEGSRHGARILLRRALAGGHPVVAKATAFLGQPFERRQWTDFLHGLAHHRSDPASHANLRASAEAAFRLFAAAANDVWARSGTRHPDSLNHTLAAARAAVPPFLATAKP